MQAKLTALYERLSHDDDLMGESNSMRRFPSWNTRRMLLMRSSNMREISRSILR